MRASVNVRFQGSAKQGAGDRPLITLINFAFISDQQHELPA